MVYAITDGKAGKTMTEKKKTTKKMSKKSKKLRRKRILKIVFIIFGVLFLIALIIFGPKLTKVFQLQKEAKKIVDASSYDTFKSTQTTVIYDTDGNELCTMRNTKDLYYLNFSEIPEDIVNAFVVVEDKKFYKHSGIDFFGILRAFVANTKSASVEQGASTITQQLAKNIFLTQDVSWERKIEEAYIAVNLEKKYTKEDILEFYLNNIYFANGYYGVEAAARGYFSKSIGELTLSEQIFLSAIPNSPTRYDPIENYEATLERRNMIIKQMYDADVIDTNEYDTALAETITINQQINVKNNYVETYVRRCATESMMAAYGFKFRYDFTSSDDYDAYKASYDASYDLYQQKLLSGGYKVYTSIDLKIQEQLQKAVDEKLAFSTTLSSEGVYEMQGASTCIDNSSGNVVAVVGGRTQNLAGYSLNRAYQSYRQPGSCIKPVSVYTPYLMLGNTPDTIVVDEPIENGPKNADGNYSGSITLREAVRVSKNTVAWKVYQEITPQTGCGFLMKLGFKKVYVDKTVVAGSLGGFTYGVTTEEMAGAYAAIANDGVYRRATCVETIADGNGKLIADEMTRGTKVYDANASRMMIDMMKTVVTSGTGTAANISNAIVCGKTGTTNSNKDAWFVGFSEYYTTSIWIGYDMPATISSPGTYTCGIFKQFMTAIHQDLPIVDFPTYTVKKEEKATEAVTEAVTEKTKKAEEKTTVAEATKNTKAEVVTKKNETTQPATIQYGDVDAKISGGDQNAVIIP